MELKHLGVLVLWSGIFVLVQSETTIYKTGWLDRVVEYFKQRFIADVHDRLPPIEFKAEIVKAPTGYVDSKQWDFESVSRLLQLIRNSEKARPVAKLLRRALNPKTRRNYKGSKKQNSYKIFPKFPSKGVNVFYEDSEYDEYGLETDNEDINNDLYCANSTLDDDSVVVISNPVEARLPSAHISVKMLREILEARAEAARVMPPTTKSTIKWIPMSTTKKAEENNGTDGGNTSDGGDGGGNSSDSGGGDNSTDDNATGGNATGGNATANNGSDDTAQ